MEFFLELLTNMYFITAAIIAILVTGFFLIYRYLGKLLIGLFTKLFSGFDDRVNKWKINPLSSDLKIFIFVYIAKLLFLAFKENLSDYIISETFNNFIEKLLAILLLFYITKILKKILFIFLDHFKDRLEKSKNKQAKNYSFLIPVIKNIGVALIAIFLATGLLSILYHGTFVVGFGWDNLAKIIGYIGLGLTFVAKDAIANFLAGIFMLVDNSLVIGDRIKIDGNEGDVVEIGIRTVKIRTLSNTIVIIPNTKINESSIISFRRYNPSSKMVYELKLSRSIDVEKAQLVLKECLKSVPRIHKEPVPKAIIFNYEERVAVYLLIFFMDDISMRGSVLNELNLAIYKRFKEEGLSLAIPVTNIVINEQLANEVKEEFKEIE